MCRAGSCRWPAGGCPARCRRSGFPRWPMLLELSRISCRICFSRTLLFMLTLKPLRKKKKSPVTFVRKTLPKLPVAPRIKRRKCFQRPADVCLTARSLLCLPSRALHWPALGLRPQPTASSSRSLLRCCPLGESLCKVRGPARGAHSRRPAFRVVPGA